MEKEPPQAPSRTPEPAEVSEGIPSDHFHGKSAVQHIAEMQSTGVSTSSEVHGAETPGPIFAFIDAARDASLALAIMLVIFDYYELAMSQKITMILAFAFGWMVWKGSRSAWLAWSRLLRLHRIASEEQKEIETNRPQEREELIALYSAKGLSSPLIDKVVDVLMADQDRLLRVMLQEEMGYRLEEQPHPLIQGFWAAGGVFAAFFFLLFPLLHVPTTLTLVICVIMVAILGGWFALLEKNNVLSAFIWNLMIGASSVLFVKIFMEIYAT